jgi:hypothetical protein
VRDNLSSRVHRVRQTQLEPERTEAPAGVAVDNGACVALLVAEPVQEGCQQVHLVTCHRFPLAATNRRRRSETRGNLLIQWEPNFVVFSEYLLME